MSALAAAVQLAVHSQKVANYLKKGYIEPFFK